MRSQDLKASTDITIPPYARVRGCLARMPAPPAPGASAPTGRRYVMMPGSANA